MSGIKGVSKSKMNKKGAGKRVVKQQLGPIPLPTDALAKIFKWMPRSRRAQMAHMSSQAAEASLDWRPSTGR